MKYVWALAVAIGCTSSSAQHGDGGTGSAGSPALPNVVIADGVGFVELGINVAVSVKLTGNCSAPPMLTGTYQGAKLITAVNTTTATPPGCVWPTLYVDVRALQHVDPTNATVELDDPANSLAIRMTLPPEIAQQRALTPVTPLPSPPAICGGQTVTLNWSPEADLVASPDPTTVHWAFVPCGGEGCTAVGFSAPGSASGSDLTFVVPSTQTRWPGGELYVAPSGAARSGVIADCQGAVSCSYQLSNLRAVGTGWEPCGSGSG
jgi:hypothetical protein